MITEWEMFWLLKLDDILGIFIIFTMCFAGFSFISMFGWFINFVEGRYEPSLNCKKRFYTTAAIAGLLAILLCFIPTTKQMAMIKVIPAIANSKAVETLKGDAADLYKLGINAAKEYLKGKNP